MRHSAPLPMRYQVKVIPRASKNQVLEIGPQELKVKLTAPPVEGKANELLIKVLAEYFRVKKAAVRIIKGGTSHHKTIEVEGIADYCQSLAK